MTIPRIPSRRSFLVFGAGACSTTIGFRLKQKSTSTAYGALWRTVQGDAAHTGYCRSGRTARIDGHVVWKVDLGGKIEAAPVVADGAAVTATADGRIAAFELDGGTKRWERRGSVAISAAPAVDSDAVYVQLTEGSMHALDLRTGETLWRTGLEVSPSGISGSVLVDGTLFISDGVVYAIDVVAGDVRWEVDPRTGDPSGPAVSDGRVFLADTAIAEALDAEDGTQIWTTEFGTRVWGPPTVGDDVYLPLGPPNVIGAFSKTTGDRKWTVSITDEPTDTFAAAPVVTEETVIAADRDGAVAAVSQTDGSVRWRHSVDGLLDHHPVACGDTVYLPTTEGVVALSMTSGEEQWRTRVGEIPKSPALAGDRLLVTTSDGHLVALGTESGFLDRWGLELGMGLGAGLTGLGGYAACRRHRNRRTQSEH